MGDDPSHIDFGLDFGSVGGIWRLKRIPCFTLDLPLIAGPQMGAKVQIEEADCKGLVDDFSGPSLGAIQHALLPSKPGAAD